MSSDSTLIEPTPEQFQTQDESFDQSILIPLAKNPLSLNLLGHMHWATKAKHVRQWRQFAGLQAKRFPALSYATITLTWFVTDRRRRDEVNLALLLKSLVDGIVDAGVLRDDTPQYVDTQSRIQPAPEGTQTAYMQLRVQSGLINTGETS